MFRPIPYPVFLLALWLLALAPAGFLYHRQAAEDAMVAEYLRVNGLGALPLSQASAVRISQQVRKDFQTDEGRFKALDMRKRSFLREDTAFLLRHREGLCGEGTRVLVNLLLHAGYDATRLTLFDRELRSFHTLVSVKVAGREFLLDSINTPQSLNSFLNERAVSVEAFRVARYDGDIGVRRASARGAAPFEHPFIERVRAYSYEAVPYTKLFSAAGINARIFNFDRPPAAISALAEKPNLIFSLAALIAAALAVLVLQASGTFRALYRRLTREKCLRDGALARRKMRPLRRISP